MGDDNLGLQAASKDTWPGIEDDVSMRSHTMLTTTRPRVGEALREHSFLEHTT